MVTSARPYRPGYGVLPPDQGTRLLPWSWAEERLISSRNYWLVSTWPDRRPRAMPGWGMWHEDQSEWAFGLEAGDFTGSPTRWDFKA